MGFGSQVLFPVRRYIGQGIRALREGMAKTAGIRVDATQRAVSQPLRNLSEMQPVLPKPRVSNIKAGVVLAGGIVGVAVVSRAIERSGMEVPTFIRLPNLLDYAPLNAFSSADAIWECVRKAFKTGNTEKILNIREKVKIQYFHHMRLEEYDRHLLFLASENRNFDVLEAIFPIEDDDSLYSAYNLMSRYYFNGDFQMVRFYVEHGMTLKDDSCAEELIHSFFEEREEKNKEILEYLIIKGCLDVNVSATTGFTYQTPAYHAAKRGDLETLKFLRSHGADFNQGNIIPPDKYKYRYVWLGGPSRWNQMYDIYLHTPVMAAIQSGNIKCLQYLLEHGADLNLPAGENKDTPLLTAVKAGNKEAVEVLLAQKANFKIADAEGLTPLGAAEKAGNQELAAILRQAGARK